MELSTPSLSIVKDDPLQGPPGIFELVRRAGRRGGSWGSGRPGLEAGAGVTSRAEGADLPGHEGPAGIRGIPHGDPARGAHFNPRILAGGEEDPAEVEDAGPGRPAVPRGREDQIGLSSRQKNGYHRSLLEVLVEIWMGWDLK